MNGKQRNIYLNYVKEQHPNDWCLALDADEVVEDLSIVKKSIQVLKPGLYCLPLTCLVRQQGLCMWTSQVRKRC